MTRQLRSFRYKNRDTLLILWEPPVRGLSLGIAQRLKDTQRISDDVTLSELLEAMERNIRELVCASRLDGLQTHAWTVKRMQKGTTPLSQ
jgi:hypothetical protein